MSADKQVICAFTDINNSKKKVYSTSDDTIIKYVSSPPAALLSTASSPSNGKYHRQARTLLDSGASVQLITEKLDADQKL